MVKITWSIDLIARRSQKWRMQQLRPLQSQKNSLKRSNKRGGSVGNNRNCSNNNRCNNKCLWINIKEVTLVSWEITDKYQDNHQPMVLRPLSRGCPTINQLQVQPLEIQKTEWLPSNQCGLNNSKINLVPWCLDRIYKIWQCSSSRTNLTILIWQI